MAKFPTNNIRSLVAETTRFELGESVGPDLRLGELLDESGEPDLNELALGYGTAEGDASLRAAIAARHNVSPEDVVITMGGMHALFLLAFILCEPGDEAVTTAPVFPLALNTLRVVGAKVNCLPLSFEAGYALDPDRLAAQLSPKTKLVSLASPQNPSGVALPRDTIKAVVDRMAEICPQATLLMDETYRDAAYGDDPVAPSAVGLSPQVVSCASLSKCHGAPGLRMGWAITRDPALREELVVGKLNTVISGSPLVEALALRVLQRGETIVGERRRRLADGLAMTADWVRDEAARVDWVRPDAGALCCLRLKPSVFDDRAVAGFYEALKSQQVRVASGTWFGEVARVFRLGFGYLAPSDLEAAFKGLSQALQQASR